MKYIAIWLLLVTFMPAQELLTDKHLRPVGAFRLPRIACDVDTAYGAGAIALRVVSGKVRLFANAGNRIYEVEVPKLRLTAPMPWATLVKEYGNIFCGLPPEHFLLNSLRWQTGNATLHWTGGQVYDTDASSTIHSGATNLVKRTAWIVDNPGPELWRRGGTVELPAAMKALTKEHIAHGFGGYYSIFEGGSYGPTLLLREQALLAYPDPHRCSRPGGYYVDRNDWVGRNDNTWTAGDEIGGDVHAGGCVWLADAVQGLVYSCRVAMGHVWYGDDGEMSGVHADSYENYLAVYDPSELAEVYLGRLQPHEPQPQWYPLTQPVLGGKGRACGMAYERLSQTLYVCFTEAYTYEGAEYPIVVAYRVEALP